MSYSITLFILLFLIINSNFWEIYYNIPFIKKSNLLKRYVKLKKYKRRNSNAINKIFLINFIVFIIYIFFKKLYDQNIISAEYLYSHYNLTCMPIIWNYFLRKPWTLLTNIFTHIEISHFSVNMLVLYYITPFIRKHFYNKEIWLLYILGGVGGSILCLLIYSTSPSITLVYFAYPEKYNQYSTLIGASGAIFSLFTAITYKKPNDVFNFYFFKFKLKYIYGYFLLNTLLSLLYGINAGGQIAHIGGVLCGLWVVFQITNKNKIF